jgi:acyl-coenzyme A synthetase/AMP-(fatty) acid ligase
MSVFDPIDLQCRLNPDKLALAFESLADGLSYRELRTLVHGAMYQLHWHRIAPGLRIGVHCRSRFLHIIASLAASRFGAALIAISPYGNFLAGTVDAVITDGMGVSGGGKLIHIDMAKLSSALAQTSGSQWPESTRAEWQFTPQTDAESAPATLSIPEDVFRARILQRAMLKGVGGDCWLCVADIRSEIGFSAILESLWCGGSIVFSHGSFEDDGAAIAVFEADRMFVAAGAVPEYFRTFDNSGYRGVHPRTIVVAGRRSTKMRCCA